MNKGKTNIISLPNWFSWWQTWHFFRSLLVNLLLLAPAIGSYTWSQGKVQSPLPIHQEVVDIWVEWIQVVDKSTVQVIWVLDDQDVANFEDLANLFTSEDMQQIENEAMQIATELHPQLVQAWIEVPFKALWYAAILIVLFFIFRKNTEKFQDWSNKQMRIVLRSAFIIAGLSVFFLMYPQFQNKIPYGREIVSWVKEVWWQTWWLIKKHGGWVLDDVYWNDNYYLVRILLSLFVWSVWVTLVWWKAKFPKKVWIFLVSALIWYFAPLVVNTVSEVAWWTTEIFTWEKDETDLAKQAEVEKGNAYKTNVLYGKREIKNQDEFIHLLFERVNTLPVNSDWEWTIPYEQNIPEIEWIPARTMPCNFSYSKWTYAGTQFFVAYVRSDTETWIIRIGNSVIVGKPWVAYASNLFKIAAYIPEDTSGEEYPRLVYVLFDTDRSLAAENQPKQQDVLKYINQLMSLPVK